MRWISCAQCLVIQYTDCKIIQGIGLFIRLDGESYSICCSIECTRAYFYLEGVASASVKRSCRPTNRQVADHSPSDLRSVGASAVVRQAGLAGSFRPMAKLRVPVGIETALGRIVFVSRAETWLPERSAMARCSWQVSMGRGGALNRSEHCELVALACRCPVALNRPRRVQPVVANPYRAGPSPPNVGAT